VIAVQSLQQTENFLSGTRIQVAGRLVGQEDGGVPGEGSGEGDALHFSPGQFTGTVVSTVFEADFVQEFERPGLRGDLGFASDDERHGRIFESGEFR
jgi:hypothetical protein